jgi:hypothetical protein
LEELYETADSLPEVERHEVYARQEDRDEWTQVPWRDSLWTNESEPQLAGEVSSSEDFYNVIQYDDILDAVGQRLEHHEISPSGHVSLSDSRHKMSAKIGLDQRVEPQDGDEIELHLHTRSGHSGYHGVKYEIGAERLVCSNGMTAFVSEHSYDQTHGEPFQPQLAYHAVDSMIEGVDTVEERLEEAQNRTLLNQDEALLVLMESGIGRYLENPVPDLLNAMHNEVDDPESPTLWETYNTATRALTHYTRDVPDYELAEGFESAAQLLESGGNELPEPERLGHAAVDNRVHAVIEQEDSEPYWEGETESLRELMEEHEIRA